LQNTNDVKDQETKFRTNTTQKHKYTIWNTQNMGKEDKSKCKQLYKIPA
jgi:hypothetical protein